MTGSDERSRRHRAVDRPARREVPHRRRRLTDGEMAELVKLARSGVKGPGRAMDALWDLILHDIEGLSLAEATASGRAWLVQNYAIADDQSRVLYDAMMLRRRLPAGALRRIGMQWFMWAPATYDDPAVREAGA